MLAADRLLPVAVFRLCVIFGMAVTLLQLAYQFIFLAVDNLKIIVRQLTPLLLGFTFDLQPLSFEYIIIHYKLISLAVDFCMILYDKSL
jgi:hypothetical protein